MSTRVYVGNLPLDVQEHELEKVFSRYGRPDSIDIKGGREGNSRFAFLEFRDSRDANDACDGENGRDFAGARLRVEIARGGRDRGFDDRGGRGGYGDRGGGGYGDRGFDDRDDRRDRHGGGDDRYGDDRRRGGLGPSPYGPSRKTDYSVEVDRRGNGNAMFASREDMEDAVSNVDGTEMKNMRGSCVVRVIPASEGRGRSRSRSP